jgi:glycosyl transferase family 25
MDFGCQRIVCISVVERTDKRQYVSHILEKLNIPFEFFIVKKDMISSARGCLTSHISVIKKAYDDGIQRLMVFEDDIRHEKVEDDRIEHIRHFLDNENWDIFFLGGTPNIWNKNINNVKDYKNIYKGHFGAAHSYILNRSYMKKIKDIKWDRKIYDTIDVHVLMQNNNSYIAYPRAFFQRVMKNDRDIPTPIIALREVGEKLVTNYAMYINIKLWKFLIGCVCICLFSIIIYRSNRHITTTAPTTI